MRRALTLGTAFLALIFYLKTLAPGVLEGDPGEFQFVPYILGIPHPPGYPLFCFLGWLWSHLFPCGSVAFRMNLFSALWGAATVGIMVYLGLEANQKPYLWPYVAGALTFAFSRTFWNQSVVAEVYSLNAFFIVLFLWAVMKDLPLPAVSFIAGLGLAHHRSFTLFLPGAVVFYLVRKRKPRGHAALSLALFLAPLLFYLLIPLRAPSLPYLKVYLSPDDTLILYGNSFRDFMDFVLARRFGGLLKWEAITWSRMVEAGQWLVEEFSWGGVILGIIGLAGLYLHRRWDVLALTGISFGAATTFNLAYLIGDIRLLYIPAYLIFSLWISCGAGELAFRLGNKAMVLFILPLALSVQNFSSVQSSGSNIINKWDYILRLPLPEGAILVSNDRDEMVPLYYFQLVEGKRPDLIPLYPLIVPELKDIGLVLDRALASGRPVFIIKQMEGLEVAYRLQEWNGLWEVAGKVEGESFITLSLKVADALTLAGYKLLKGEGEVEIALYWETLHHVGEDLHSYIHILGPEGERIAGSDHRPGGVFYPTSLWKPGQLLKDIHRIEGSFTFPLHLKVGFYRWPSLEPYGQAVEFEVKP